ncbi:MAG TPA: nitroreductase/quinone reductase family protein [Acidimicrobiales bacterium]|jgi:deazaflavin-dependent oxidoreductase (nitroreductase family)
MADTPAPRVDIREQNQKIIADYRATGGKPADGGFPLVLLTTIGNKTGNAHTTPVCVREDGDDLIVAGSMGGMKKHPQWYRNLQANPELTVEYLGDTYRARAELVPNSQDRNRLFDMMSEVIIGLYSYQDRAAEFRQIPVIRLVRIPE